MQDVSGREWQLNCSRLEHGEKSAETETEKRMKLSRIYCFSKTAILGSYHGAANVYSLRGKKTLGI